ncbi:MAG TPA: ABC transporter substrate-binding protein [Flavobacteriales bacterium]|nr:ABC transporter substrate-binding protein [Flavobacteriales bacterium]
MIRPQRTLHGALLALLALVACTPGREGGSWDGWERQHVQAATFFQLWHQGDARLLLTFGPGGETDTTGLFVVGGEASMALPPGAVHLAAPLRQVALLSTTHASFLSALGLADAVVGCAHVGRLRDPLVKARADAGAIAEVGAAEGLDRERVLVLAPEALFVYPYGTEADRGSFGALPMIPVAEYLERDPLGRAEWIRVFGVLMGKEEEAAGLFRGIAGRYEQAKAMVPPGAQRPRVFFGSSWKGAWSIPSGRSYMAHLIADAGGDYLFADREAPGNIGVALEQVLQTGVQADFWGRIIDLERAVTESDVAGDDGRIRALPAFAKHGAFYANSRESDIFGQAGLEPDVVLLDLVQVFHSGLLGDRVPVYFRAVQ